MMSQEDRYAPGPDVASACLATLRLLCEVAGLCNDAASVPSIAQRVLSRTCEFNGWFAGRVHVIDSDGAMGLVAMHHDSQATTTSASLDQLNGSLLSDVCEHGKAVWQRTEFSAGSERAVTGVGAPIRTNGAVLGVLTLISESRPPLADEIRSAVETVATLLGGVVERRSLDRTIAESSTEEQQRIGRELHDSVGQSLSGAALLADGIARRLEQAGGEEVESVRRVAKNIREALVAVRGITEGLIPLELEDGGLHVAIRRMTDAVKQRSDVAVSLEGRAPTLPAHISRELFLIASEALRNAVTHGQPSLINVKWSVQEDAASSVLMLEVRDNGPGISTDNGYESGRGIAIMRHRASVIGGTFEIASMDAGGTIVRCEIPMPSRAGARSIEEA